MSQYTGNLFPLPRELGCDKQEGTEMPGLGPCLPSLVKKKDAEFVTEQDMWDQYGCRHWVAELIYLLIFTALGVTWALTANL